MSDATDKLDPTAAEADLSGRELGDYRILRRLGHGAMAVVYLAEQLSLRRQVALKILKSDRAADETYVRRFDMEARAAAALVHANIVQIYEVGQIDGVHYIAQEYVQGQNLSQLLKRHGSPDVRLAVAIIRQVSAALYKAAQQGIVHRDIKPENIMLTAAGEVKVADFGLARITGDGEAPDLTQAGMTLGTPLYMSPEQVEGHSLDPRSDIYSFGVTCYHLLAGRPPFEGDTALAVAVQHLKTQPERLENARPDLPGGLCRVVHKMLAKDPAGRYQSIPELLRELRTLKIEGLDDDWYDELDEWTAAELSALADTRLEATARLEALMKQSAARPSRRWVGWLSAAALVTCAAGAAIGWNTREPSLLDHDAAPTGVERQASAKAQYMQAEFPIDPDQEEAYLLAVVEFFSEAKSPDDLLYVRFAEQDLALLYLQREWYFDALDIFDRFAEMEQTESQFRAFGLAGQYVVLFYQGQLESAWQKRVELEPLLTDLDDQKMWMLVDQIDPEIRRAMADMKDSNKPDSPAPGTNSGE